MCYIRNMVRWIIKKDILGDLGQNLRLTASGWYLQ